MILNEFSSIDSPCVTFLKRFRKYFSASAFVSLFKSPTALLEATIWSLELEATSDINPASDNNDGRILETTQRYRWSHLFKQLLLHYFPFQLIDVLINSDCERTTATREIIKNALTSKTRKIGAIRGEPREGQRYSIIFQLLKICIAFRNRTRSFFHASVTKLSHIWWHSPEWRKRNFLFTT